MKRIISPIFLLVVLSGASTLLPAQSERNTLQLRVDPAHFSPNDDDLQDQVFFYPVLTKREQINRWTMDIFSAKRMKRVARLSGGALPALIKWNGADKKGARVGDGAYVARLTAVGRKKMEAEQVFAVDTTPPAVSLTISTPVFDRGFLDKGQLALRPRIEDGSPIDRWLLQVVDAAGRNVFVFLSSGSVAEVQWNGTDRATGVLLPPGDYRVLLQAWDKAGNESMPAYADLKANVTPREMLERALERIRVNEAGLGLIVQLDAAALFARARSRYELSTEGQQLLREVSILVNAYPNVSVKLDGYSRAKKTAAQDRELASLYAWRLYSYMIKTGNVKPSRLTVRGRGRSPMFERRDAGVPLIKNGVEVVLEGSGPW